MPVHSNDHSSTEQHGSRACQRPRCHTCQYISPDTEIRGTNYSFSVRGHFTFQSSNLVYCISCNRCPTILYIGETGRNLRSRFSEHLRSIRNNTPVFPVAQHFNSTDHSISDIRVRDMQLCNGTNLQRKQREMRLSFQLGTVQPAGLSINVSYIWIVTFNACARYYSYVRVCPVAYFNGFLHAEEGLYTRNVCFFQNHFWHFLIFIFISILS